MQVQVKDRVRGGIFVGGGGSFLMGCREKTKERFPRHHFNLHWSLKKSLQPSPQPLWPEYKYGLKKQPTPMWGSWQQPATAGLITELFY